MIETLLFACAASLAVFGSAALVLSALALRAVRRYVELAEERMELLSRGQTRLFALPADEHRVTEEATPERGLEELREARRRIPLPAVAAGASEAQRESRRLQGKGRKDGSTPPRGFPETSAAGRKPLADGSLPREGRPRLGVRHPHPDDAGLPTTPLSPTASGGSAAPVEMFRRHYDKYLENYRGYVELAEHLRRTRDEAGASSSFEERDREERLRRVNDGIERTIARLDILEGLNPELAADDRVSRRALIAQRHAELA